MGVLATGTSCFALVWVIGRSRVPLPPARMTPFTVGMVLAEADLSVRAASVRDAELVLGVLGEALVVDLAVGGATDGVDGEGPLGCLVGSELALDVGDQRSLVELAAG